MVESPPQLLRDEEVVGSNPATPTVKYQVRGLIQLMDQAPDGFPEIVWENLKKILVGFSQRVTGKAACKCSGCGHSDLRVRVSGL